MIRDAPSPPPLPARLLRHDLQYRSTPGVGVGAGLMLKPTRVGGYLDRVIQQHVLVYVLRGKGTYIDPQAQRHAVRAGDAIQMLADRPHGIVQDPDGQWAEAFVIVDRQIEGAFVAMRVIDPARTILHPGVDLAIADQFDRLLADLQRLPDDRVSLMTARIHEIIATIYIQDRQRQERSPHVAMVEEACRLISRQTHRKRDVDELLTRHALSYERFRKIFRDLTGQSPNDYRIRRRIDSARALLTQQRMSIKQVAYTLGYPDPFTFSRQFKQLVGVSPKQFARAGA